MSTKPKKNGSTTYEEKPNGTSTTRRKKTKTNEQINGDKKKKDKVAVPAMSSVSFPFESNETVDSFTDEATNYNQNLPDEISKMNELLGNRKKNFVVHYESRVTLNRR